MLKFSPTYPANSTQKVFPSVLSRLLDTPLHLIEPIIKQAMPLNKKGMYTFSGKALKESFSLLTSLRSREVLLEDISQERVIIYGSIERKMTLGTFVNDHPEGEYLIILENGYSVGLAEGILLANEALAGKAKSRLFRMYKLVPIL